MYSEALMIEREVDQFFLKPLVWPRINSRAFTTMADSNSECSVHKLKLWHPSPLRGLGHAFTER